jgi:hypothetical protein
MSFWQLNLKSWATRAVSVFAIMLPRVRISAALEMILRERSTTVKILTASPNADTGSIVARGAPGQMVEGDTFLKG